MRVYSIQNLLSLSKIHWGKKIFLSSATCTAHSTKNNDYSARAANNYIINIPLRKTTHYGQHSIKSSKISKTWNNILRAFTEDPINCSFSAFKETTFEMHFNKYDTLILIQHKILKKFICLFQLQVPCQISIKLLKQHDCNT